MVMGDNSVQTDIRAESSQTSDSTKRRLLRSLPTRTRLTYTSGWGRYCVCTSIIKRAWGACSRMRFSAWAATIKWFRERWQALKNWYGSRWVVVWFQKTFPGWEYGVVWATIVGIGVLNSNVIFLIVAMTKNKPRPNGLGTLLEGGCSKVDWGNKVAHGVINVLSTVSSGCVLCILSYPC